MINKLVVGLILLLSFPVFSILMVALAGSAIFVIGVGLLRSLGFSIGMNLLFVEVPVLLSLPVALLFSAAFLYLSYMCWRMMKKLHILAVISRRG